MCCRITVLCHGIVVWPGISCCGSNSFIILKSSLHNVSCFSHKSCYLIGVRRGCTVVSVSPLIPSDSAATWVASSWVHRSARQLLFTKLANRIIFVVIFTVYGIDGNKKKIKKKHSESRAVTMCILNAACSQLYYLTYSPANHTHLLRCSVIRSITCTWSHQNLALVLQPVLATLPRIEYLLPTLPALDSCSCQLPANVLAFWFSTTVSYHPL